MEAQEERKHGAVRRFFDNTWLLLALGFVIPFLSYFVWGWIEIAAMKPAQLP